MAESAYPLATERFHGSSLQPLQRGNRLAATVMLVRDSDEGLQVYMIKGPAEGIFLIFMFSGGKLEEND